MASLPPPWFSSTRLTDMALAYLLNWYPMPSQTALRREVAALEALGVTIHRFSLRRYQGELVDANDRAVTGSDPAVLDAGALTLMAAVLRTAATRPRAFAPRYRLPFESAGSTSGAS